MNERKLLQKQDFILIAVLLALASASLVAYAAFNRGADKIICRISSGGEIVRTVDFSNEGVFFLEEKPQIQFEVKDGGIAFIESDCPDKVCVNSGFLSRAGQMAACLPNDVSIYIISGSGTDAADMIAH